MDLIKAVTAKCGITYMNQLLKITDRVQSFEDILSIAGKTMEDLAREGDTPDEIAYKALKLGIKVLNEEWVADYSDYSQDKYEPRFYHKTGFGLSCNVYDDWSTNTRVGPRLTYRSYEIMKHGLKIMDKFYNDYFN